MNMYPQSLIGKLAALKVSGWLLANAASLGYYLFIQEAAPPKSLYILILLGGTTALAGVGYAKRTSTHGERDTFLYLLSDILFLSFAIHITGGITNPFTSSLLVPVALGIALLPKHYSLINVGVASTIYLAWLLSGDHHNMMHHNFSLHLYGMGINFLLSAALLYIFVTHALGAVKTQEDELIKTREKIINDEQLIGIASLTANTAHAIGTPLQTLTLITDELTPNQILDKNDLDLIKQQIATCKNHLQQIVKTSDIAKEGGNTISLEQLNDKLSHHYSLQPHHKELSNTVDSTQKEVHMVYSESLFYAIINLIDNALKAAKNNVIINYSSTNQFIVIHIDDDGPGIPEHIAHTIGQPFTHNSEEGLGLGYYLSNYTIEKNGGGISMSRRTAGGTQTNIQLPRIL